MQPDASPEISTAAAQTIVDITAGKATFYDWQGFNQEAFLIVNRLRGEPYDTLMQWITKLGAHELFLPYLALTLAYVAISYYCRSHYGSGLRRHYLIRWGGIVLVMCASFAATGLAVHFMKVFFQYPRPAVYFGAMEVFLLEQLPPEKMHQSFPSGHVAFITLIVASLWPGLSGFLRGLGALLIVAVCWSRVSVGAHFPADVATGFFVALILTILLRWIIYWILRRYFNLYC